MGSFSGNSKFSWWVSGSGDIAIAGHDGKNLKAGKVINLEVDYNPATDGARIFENALLYYGEFNDKTSHDFMNPNLWRGRGRVEITANAKGVLSGSFQGTLSRINGEGPSSVTMNGNFAGIAQDPLDR